MYRFSASAAVAITVLITAGYVRAEEVPAIINDRVQPALPVTGKQFSFVFDDGPLPESTPVLLAALKQANMKATFAVVGKNVSAHPDLARQIVAEGHEIANRSWSNIEMAELPIEEVTKEIQAGYDIIVQTTGVKPRFFRPPASQSTPDIDAVAAKFGMLVLMHSFDSGDWRKPASGEVTRLILTGITPGAIISLHESFPESVAEVPRIIETLSKRGFQSFTVSELKSKAGVRFVASSSANE